MTNYQVAMTFAVDDAVTPEDVEDLLRVLAEEQGWRVASLSANEIA